MPGEEVGGCAVQEANGKQVPVWPAVGRQYHWCHWWATSDLLALLNSTHRLVCRVSFSCVKWRFWAAGILHFLFFCQPLCECLCLRDREKEMTFDVDIWHAGSPRPYLGHFCRSWPLVEAQGHRRRNIPMLDQRVKLEELEMWANAQRDGRPAETRWRPLFNAAVWLMPTTRVPCSN